jgi:Phosphotransferase enzyme family
VHLEWIDSVLPAPRSGEPEVVRERPWSLVVKVPTAQGRYWFKENRAQTRYEAGLIEALARWAPGRVPAPVAVDARRGWSLLPDGGPTLREAGDADWESLLAGYARLQRDLVPHAAEMLALGVPDLRPSAMPAHLKALAIPPAVAAYLPTLLELCAEMADGAIPPSLQHDDLHDANVFTSGHIFDWGDASLAHPFGTLLVTLRVAERLGQDTDRLRDAYLEPWNDLASRAQLLREAQIAQQVAKVGRALSWQRALAGSSPEVVATWEDPVSGWLEELLDSPD